MTGPYWQDTFNPVMGCTPTSPGCTNCWARQMHERFRATQFSNVRTLPYVLSKPLRRRKPTTFFVCNTSDLFHPSVPFEFIAAVYGVMAACPQHTFLTCTKRPERRAEFMMWIAPLGKERECCWQATAALDRSVDDPLQVVDAWPLPNVWEGVTAEDQQRADERIPILLDTPAAHRWVSAEPLLGPIDLSEWLFCDECRQGPFGPGVVQDLLSNAAGGKPWRECWCRHDTGCPTQIIIGGESGKGARPCDVQWIRDIVRQCREAGVRCFVKQIHIDGKCVADVDRFPIDLNIRELAWRP